MSTSFSCWNIIIYSLLAQYVMNKNNVLIYALLKYSEIYIKEHVSKI